MHTTKLEQFDIGGKNDESLEKIRKKEEEEDEMPIIKNSSSTTKSATSNGQLDGNDKGIFNVSRVKKVELSEIPLDISAATSRKFIIQPLILFAPS